MPAESKVFVYQLRVWLLKISPAIWRRLLVRSDSTIADLHYIIQIAMDWTDYHLHQFTIRGKRYGIPRIPGPSFVDNPHQVQLGDFCFRTHERFLYEYDFRDSWQHEIRVEKQLPLEKKKTYPLCVSGARLAPPEECGGPWRFMELRQHYSIGYMAEVLLGILDTEYVGKYREQHREEIRKFQYWLSCEQFSRHEVNVRLKQYIVGDPAWQKGEVILI